jgi:hypothetical protein
MRGVVVQHPVCGSNRLEISLPISDGVALTIPQLAPAHPRFASIIHAFNVKHPMFIGFLGYIRYLLSWGDMNDYLMPLRQSATHLLMHTLV